MKNKYLNTDFIDTHAHIIPSLFSNVNTILNHCNDQNIKIINIGFDYKTSLEVLKLNHDAILGKAIGVHPLNYKLFNQNFIRLFDWAKDMCIAIGEIGIDTYYDDTYLSRQIEVFYRQLMLAKTYHLPVLIHCRGVLAFEKLSPILSEFPTLKGIIHSFNGTYEDIKKLSNNFYIGINHLITYRTQKYRDKYKTIRLWKVIKKVPLNRILLETDSPFLSPELLKIYSLKNHPLNIKNVHDQLCRLMKIKPNVLMQQLKNNFNKLFNYV